MVYDSTKVEHGNVEGLREDIEELLKRWKNEENLNRETAIETLDDLESDLEFREDDIFDEEGGIE
ncbi:hypothetical protein [Haloplanus natans]|uniref:hypothetical protein n=1 Tax=Haloplanus natans TaxID=376171 RepID=UPI0006777425|nr:hypothetical protein [Haloplanus natans]